MPKIFFSFIAFVTIVASFMCPTAPAAESGPSQRQKSQQEQDLEDAQVKALNKQRQQDIKKDTEKLFQLATELKAAVDKSNENLLSIEVVRKADEVERLAHRVKEKMKEGVGPAPEIPPPPPIATPR